MINAMTPAERRAMREEADKREALAALATLAPQIEAGRYIYLSTDVADPGADCWAWLRGFIGLAYDLIKAHRLCAVRILFTYERREGR